MAARAGNASSNIYVAVNIGPLVVNCLVDTGAAYSLCSERVIPPDTVISPTSIRLKGVTGTPLQVIGQISVPIKFGNTQKPIQLVVVKELNHQMILGRDFMSTTGCQINFKNLTLSVDDEDMPLIKASHKPIKHALVASSMHSVKPNTVALIKCKLVRRNPKRSKEHVQSYISTTGIVHPKAIKITSSSGFYNSNRGSLHVLVCNETDKDVVFHRNSKIGTFETVSEDFVNNINHCLRAHAHRRDNMSKQSTVNSVDREHTLNHERWSGNHINRLFELLKLDDLNTHLTAEQVEQVKLLVREFKDIFSEGENDIGCTDMMEQTIVLDTQVPIRAKYRNIPLAHRQAAEKEVKRLLDLGVIQYSESPYHSPSFLQRKPDGSFRILTDFRLLNSHVVRSYQSVPSVEMMSSCWKGCKFYSKMDFIKGFYQCKLDPKSRKYTATCIPGVAFFEYCKTPLGLSSSPGFFQSLVQRMMEGLKFSEVVAYLDDLLSGSPTFEGMLSNLRLIFERILISKMLLSPKKVELFKTKLNFLGVTLSEAGVSVCADKLDAVCKMLPPKSAKGIKSFLGMTGFFRKFIKNYAKIAAPLTRLLKKEATFVWGEEQQTAWEALKHALTVAPTLIHPDVNKQFTLMTDSSSYAIGSILCQRNDKGDLQPVAFASKVLTDAEQKWSIVQKELFSLKYFCEKFKTYLLNQKFEAIVDNAALLHLDSFKHSDNKRLWRWFETLQNYDFTVTLHPSKANPSDGPSRLVRKDDPGLSYLPERAEVSVNLVSNITPERDGKIINEASELVPWSDNSILSAQQSDTTIKSVISWIELGRRPESSRDLSPDEKTYFNSFDRLSLINGLLHRTWDNTTDKNVVNLLCIPQSLQDRTIALCHDVPMSGHYGKNKTVSKLTSRFYFPKLRHKVELYIDNCNTCLKKAKNRKTPKAPLKPFVASYPNDVVQIDIVESLPPVNGYHAILTIIDRFTMYAEAIPLRSTTVDVVARAVLNHYISRHGIPTAIHSDRGGSVHTADLIQALYKLMGIEKTVTTAYRPQSNGGVERFNGTLKGLLWSYCQENPRNWLACLDQVLFAYRTTVHSSTGYSPFFLRYGTHPRLPVDVIAGTNPPNLENKAQNKYARDLYYKLHDVYAYVRKHLNAKQLSMKKQFDRSSHTVHFKIGEFVYVWKPAPAGCNHRKFYDHYKGPFKILSKMTEYTYKIDLGNNKCDVVHMEKLRKAKPPVSTAPQVPDIRVHDNKNHSLDPQSEEAEQEVIFRNLPSGRPTRVRNPVRRLGYNRSFVQTEN